MTSSRTLAQVERTHGASVHIEGTWPLKPHHNLNELLAQKDLMLRELQHRHANTLQAVGAILSIKARKTASEEARRELVDVRNRVMSLASIQQELTVAGKDGVISMTPFLTRLCEALTQSVGEEHSPISLKVVSDTGNLSSSYAALVGQIIAELVTNARKHAFPNGRIGHIGVIYKGSGNYWELEVRDDGIGEHFSEKNPGLGTSIVAALSKQLSACVHTSISASGRSVSVRHDAPLPRSDSQAPSPIE